MKYSFRYSAFSEEVTYSVEPAGLKIFRPKGEKVIPYAEIKSVQLSYNSASRGVPEAYFCNLKIRTGETLRLKSLHFVKMGSFEDRREDYSAFLEALHLALLPLSGVQFVKGSSRSLYVFSWLMAIVVVIFGGGLSVALLLTGSPLRGVLCLLAFVIIGWKLRVFMLRNRPGTYLPSKIPNDLLPSSDHS